MKKFMKKENIRNILIGLIVLVTVGTVIATTTITPAKQGGESVVTEDSAKKKINKENAEQSKDKEAKQEQTKKNSQTEKKEEAGQVAVDSDADQKTIQNSEVKPKQEETINKTEKPEENQTSGQVEQKPQVNQQTETQFQCTVSISCAAISGNGILTANGHPQEEAYAANPDILSNYLVSLKEGDTAYTILQKACQSQGIALDSEYTKAYNSYYVKGINHLYEFYAGFGSGWMYTVNGQAPGVGASAYKLKEGDVVLWYYVTSPN